LDDKKKVNTEQLDEGVKEVILGALMSLSFMNPASAKDTVNKIDTSKISKATLPSIVKDIKSDKNKDAVEDSIKNYTIESPSSNIEVIRKDIKEPSEYVPVTIEQRQDWNKYLEYLEAKGLAGSPELDKGVPTEGRKVFKEYLKTNKSSLNNVDPDKLIKSIQYEMKCLRSGKKFPGLTSDQLEYFQGYLKGAKKNFMDIKTSDSDGNPGQYTTQEYYPSFMSGTNFDYKEMMDRVYKALVTTYKALFVNKKPIPTVKK
jgi:hypothetical protein